MPCIRRERALALLRRQRADSGAFAITDVALLHQATQAAAAAGRLEAGHPLILRDPVGTGKTAVALTAACLLLDDGIIGYLLLVTPNTVVAEQWYERAEAPFGKKRRKNGGRWKRDVICVATHHTMPTRPSPDPARTLVIVDEAHRGLQRKTDVYDQLRVTAAGAKLLLVSATPFQMSTAGLTSMLGLGTGIDQTDAEALRSYGRSLTEVLRAFDQDPGLAEDDPVAVRASQLKDAAAKALGRHLLPRTKMKVPRPPPPDISCISLGSWAAGYHVARVLPELVGAGKNDSFQRGLVSSSETVRHNRVIGERITQLRGRSSDPRIHDFLEALDQRLGRGADHPKIAATTDWVVSQVEAGHHVIVFTVWKATQQALRNALAERLSDDTVTGPLTGTISKPFLKRVCQPAHGSPVVLVLTDRFSESIDLDGGCPSLVHHDLSWNPVRLTQRWGRVVRVRTGFVPIPTERIYIPVLDTESDRRLARIVVGRMNKVGLMVPAVEGTDAWQLPDKLLRRITTTGT